MSRNGTWLTTAAIRRSAAAAASALPPPIEEPKVATRSPSMPGSERAQAIAARQSSSWRPGSNRSVSPPLSPKPRWSKTSAAIPAAAKRSAKGPRPSRRVPESPWAMTAIGVDAGAPSTSYSQAAQLSSPIRNSMSRRLMGGKRRGPSRT